MASTPDRTTDPRSAERHPRCPHCGDHHPKWEYDERFDETALRLGCPTCGRSFRPGDRATVFRELFELVASRRNAEHADRLVTALLRYERGTRELVGVTADAERVLYLETGAKRLRSREFDRHGVYDHYDETLTWRVGDAESWLERFGDDLRWVHPRYD